MRGEKPIWSDPMWFLFFLCIYLNSANWCKGYIIFSQIFAMSLNPFELLIVILFFRDQVIREQVSIWTREVVSKCNHHSIHRSAALPCKFQSIIYIYIIRNVSNETDGILVRYILIGMLNVSTPNFIRFQVDWIHACFNILFNIS